MEISQLTLARLWLYAFFMGTELGAVYDALCVTRVFLGVSLTPAARRFLVKHPMGLLRPIKRLSDKPLFLNLLCFIEDLLFPIYAAISAILLFYAFNNGKIRIPIFFCILFGFLLYRWGLGRFFKPVLEIAALVLYNSCRYTVKCLLFPFRSLANLLVRGALAFYRKRLKKRERKQRIRFTNAEKRRLDHNACGML